MRAAFFFCVYLAYGFTSLSAEIVQAAGYPEVEQAFSGADKNTLGVFDIDGVLTYPSDPAFQKGSWRNQQQFVKNTLKGMTPEQIWLFENFSLVQADSKVMDANEWAVIRRLQDRAIRLIALTEVRPGLLGDIYMPEWRYQQLRKLGIDFSASFPKAPSFCMSNLFCYSHRYPIFQQGILFANGDIRLNAGECNKGDVLVEFIHRVSWKPKKVIVVDDSLQNLKTIEKALSYFDPDIVFLGVHFTYTPPQESILPEVFQARWNYVKSLVEACTY